MALSDEPATEVAAAEESTDKQQYLPCGRETDDPHDTM